VGTEAALFYAVSASAPTHSVVQIQKILCCCLYVSVLACGNKKTKESATVVRIEHCGACLQRHIKSVFQWHLFEMSIFYKF